ncbi:hypothetical protein ACIHFD_64680 [Nonomuraea sp. NPDC051941]|uniref:hypothetical protein n=1 Tax=Nonomuraea sp. NPDC051941 TaxID=3364373 RepID=UPI0037C577C9
MPAISALLADGDGFEQAATAWNLTIRQPVEAADADDVAALVRHARRAGMTVTAQERAARWARA